MVIREPYRDGRENTWTGIGFMRAIESSFIEFTIDDIVSPMRYDIVVRYEPQTSEQWDMVVATIKVEPDDNTNQYGYCQGSPNDVRQITLPKGARNTIAIPNACLEPDKTYKVRLDFSRYNVNSDTPSPASVLIDSVSEKEFYDEIFVKEILYNFLNFYNFRKRSFHCLGLTTDDFFFRLS